MIDGIKLRCFGSDKQKSILNNTKIDFTEHSRRSYSKTQPVYYTEGSYRGLKILLYASGLTEIRGSIHKYFNFNEADNSSYNYDDFYFSELCNTIDEISSELTINPSSIAIHNIEFGVNIQPPESSYEYLNSILNYKYIVPDVETFAGAGHLLLWEYDDYKLKIYNKGQQYNIFDEIVRFEIQAKAMKFVNFQNFLFLNDLKNRSILNKLGEILVKKHNGVMYYEKIPACKITKEDKMLLYDYSNPHYWTKLKANSSRQKILKNKRKFEAVKRKYIGISNSTFFSGLICNKYNTLLYN